jgi:hypothetical protein
MSDKMDGIAWENPAESEAAGEVRAAWLGLIRLLAREVIRRLDRGESPPGEDTKSNVPIAAEPGPRAKPHPSGRSRNQGVITPSPEGDGFSGDA